MVSVELSTRERDGQVVVALGGDLDVAGAAKFAASLAVIAASGRNIIVDLADLEFIDSSGLAALVRARQNHWPQDRSLRAREMARNLELLLRTSVAAFAMIADAHLGARSFSVCVPPTLPAARRPTARDRGRSPRPPRSARMTDVPPTSPDQLAKESVMSIIAWIILGLVAGLIANMLIPGRRQQGLILTCVIGIVGALLGGWVATKLFHIHSIQGFFNASTWLTAIAGAAILLLAYHLISGQSSSRRGWFAHR
jgi:anti-anti-sigma factor